MPGSYTICFFFESMCVWCGCCWDFTEKTDFAAIPKGDLVLMEVCNTTRKRHF